MFQTPDPKFCSPEPRVQIPGPIAQTQDPKAQTPDLRVETPEPRWPTKICLGCTLGIMLPRRSCVLLASLDYFMNLFLKEALSFSHLGLRSRRAFAKVLNEFVQMDPSCRS